MLGPSISGSAPLFGVGAGMGGSMPAAATAGMGSWSPYAAMLGGSGPAYDFTMPGQFSFLSNPQLFRSGMNMMQQAQGQPQQGQQQNVIASPQQRLGNPVVRNQPVSQPMPYTQFQSAPPFGFAQQPFGTGGSYV